MQKTKVILLYDGKCNVCNSAVRFTISRVNPRSEFYYASLQSVVGGKIVAEYGLNCFEDNKNKDIPTSSAVIVNGKGYVKSKASIVALRHLKFPYMIMGYFLSVLPTSFTDFLYSKFASYRFFLFGGTDNIQPLPQHSEHLFLDRDEEIHTCPMPKSSSQ